MNKTQFIQKWCPEGRRDEMLKDLKWIVKDAFEEHEYFVPDKTEP